jgi:hypothetical protein
MRVRTSWLAAPSAFRLGLGAATAAILAVAGHARPAQAQLNCNAGIDFYPGGAIRSCVLNGHHRIHTARGVPVACADGHPLVQYENGRLESCTLATALTADSRRCEAGQRAEFDPDGALARCVEKGTPRRAP